MRIGGRNEHQRAALIAKRLSTEVLLPEVESRATCD
jgi:hypothetical protein